MDQTAVSELRIEVGRLARLAHDVLDGLDAVHRKLSEVEDSQAAYQSSVRRLRTHLDAS